MSPAQASSEEHGHSKNTEACESFAPQTPRDIDNVKGTNNITFNFAPPASNMNLCNIHFHENAEHKAKDFSLYAGDGQHGPTLGHLRIRCLR